MYRIAICDDNIEELEKTQHDLMLWQKAHPDYSLRIRRFEDVEELLDAVRENEYAPDFILLDICMRKKSGIVAARELREMGSECGIIFLTASRDHALDAFGVYAADYLIKPVTEEILFSMLDRLLIKEDEKRKNYLLLRIDNKSCRVAVKDVVTCEAQGKWQRLELADGTSRQLRTTITEIYGMLSGRPEFVKVGVSYIINLGHVDSLSAQELFLDTGKSVFLPRGSYRALRERFYQYYCENYNGGGYEEKIRKIVSYKFRKKGKMPYL